MNIERGFLLRACKSYLHEGHRGCDDGTEPLIETSSHHHFILLSLVKPRALDPEVLLTPHHCHFHVLFVENDKKDFKGYFLRNKQFTRPQNNPVGCLKPKVYEYMDMKTR